MLNQSSSGSGLQWQAQCSVPQVHHLSAPIGADCPSASLLLSLSLWKLLCAGIFFSQRSMLELEITWISKSSAGVCFLLSDGEGKSQSNRIGMKEFWDRKLSSCKLCRCAHRMLLQIQNSMAPHIRDIHDISNFLFHYPSTVIAVPGLWTALHIQWMKPWHGSTTWGL